MLASTYLTGSLPYQVDVRLQRSPSNRLAGWSNRQERFAYHSLKLLKRRLTAVFGMGNACERPQCRIQRAGVGAAVEMRRVIASKTHFGHRKRGKFVQSKRPGRKVQVFLCVGVYLSYRVASNQVLSARVSLTAVFGMGTGVPSPSSTPTRCVCSARHIHI